ncbi:MAG: elongation factor P [Spirochaetia bacterium]
MIKAGQIEKGMFILIKGDPYIVAEREFINPGKGSAFTRAKLKNLKTGQVLKPTFKTQETVEEIDVQYVDCQYLYGDSDNYYFMNLETYEQFPVAKEGLEDKGLYMKEGESYQVTVWEEGPIDILLPYKIVYEVTEAEDAVKGDTVTGASKIVTVETGLTVKVPIFIKQGEKILVNTETGEYVERVNN